MKSIILTSIILLSITFSSSSQKYNVKIEGQIIGYDGFSELFYSISDGNYYRHRYSTQPDSLGRFTILKSIKNIKYFHFYYRNKNQKDISYSCRLVLQPNTNYAIIAKGQKRTDYMIPYSPDIYSWNNISNDHRTFYKMDYGQIYFNLADNGTMGYLYHDEWDLKQPDSLLAVLGRKTNKQISHYADLLEKGDINRQFFEIAKLNVEYFNAYRLGQTIKDTWAYSSKFGIKDSSIVSQLIDIYSELFKLYPVEGTKLECIYGADRYIDLYLHYLQGYKNGKFSPPLRGENHYANIDEIKSEIPIEVYKEYKMRNTFSQVGGLQLKSAKSAKEFLDEYPDLKNTSSGDFLVNELIPRSEAFDSLSKRNLSEEVILLDKNGPITSFQQLLDSIGNKPIYVDFWGTWCSPCRYQFKYSNILKQFLEKNGIEMLYIANEYNPDRTNWKKLISAYNLKGYHFISNDIFNQDLKGNGGIVTGLPTYMIITSKGEIVESNALWPSDGEKLFNQLKELLKL